MAGERVSELELNENTWCIAVPELKRPFQTYTREGSYVRIILQTQPMKQHEGTFREL